MTEYVHVSRPAEPAPPIPPPRHRPWGRQALLLGGSALAGAALTLQLTTTAPPSPSLPSVASASAPVAGAPAADAPVGGYSPDVRSPSGSTTTTRTAATAAQSRGVVLIETTSPSGSGAGTGMVLTASGRVLTNSHVVQGTTALRVTVASSEASYAATVVGRDAERDVALLQLAGAGDLATITPDDHELDEGDGVVAVGNAQGQGYLTAAPGTVTDTDASVSAATGDAGGSEELAGVLETDAAAEPGDSGGPLFDEEDEVVGMTTAGSDSNGSRGATGSVSFAIGVDDALAVADQIASGSESGSVRVGPAAYLGITAADDGGAVVVRSVQDGTAADEAGLAPGDTLTGIGTAAVASTADVSEALAAAEPGDRVPIRWVTAAGDSNSASVTLGASPVN